MQGPTAPRPKDASPCIAVLLIVLFLLAAYGNSLNASWHFDDYNNIVDNPNVHPKDFSLPELTKSFHGTTESGLQRPLAFLTFALNFLVHGDQVLGYHLVNLAIHLAAALVLFRLCARLLGLPLFQGRFAENANAIALLATLLWAANPVQASAVTYIVQRMASLAALLSLLALSAYLSGRLEQNKKRGIIYFVIAAVAGLLALASKENGVLLPASLVLLEVLFLRPPHGTRQRVRLWGLLLAAGLIMGLAALFFCSPSTLLSGYEHRPFTPVERLLTQPRALLFYLSLLASPTSNRLTFLHDLPISRSLTDPWTTVPAMAAILLLCGGAMALRRRQPLWAFALLFFFLNHAVESSILSLELIFEHRNYLPSAFLFLPVAVALVDQLPRILPNRTRILAFLCQAVLLISLGHTTHLRNRIFANEIRFWMDNAEKSPRLMRPWQNLGIALFLKGNLEDGSAAMHNALTADTDHKALSRFDIHYNLGQYYFLKREMEPAWFHYSKALEIQQLSALALKGMASIRFFQGDLAQAEALMRQSVAAKPTDASLVHGLAIILLRQGKLTEAETLARQAMRQQADYLTPLMTLAEIALRQGNLHAAARHYHAFHRQRPTEIDAILGLVEAAGRAGSIERRQRYVEALLGVVPLSGLRKAVDDFGGEKYAVGQDRKDFILRQIETVLASAGMDKKRGP